MDMVTIPKEEYERLKALEKRHEEAPLDIVEQFDRGIEDLKAGRFRRVR